MINIINNLLLYLFFLFILQQQHDEVHYAELALVIPKMDKQQQQHKNSSTLPHSKKPPAYNYFDEPTIYAQIDHYKTATSPFPPLISPVSQQSTLYPTKPFLREIVTIRTPLVFAQQESCV